MTATEQKIIQLLDSYHAQGLCNAAQIFSSVKGKPVLSLCFGRDHNGTPININTPFAWYCMTKPIFAFVVLDALLSAGFDESTKVGIILDDWPFISKSLTFQDLLSHQAQCKTINGIVAGKDDKYIEEIISLREYSKAGAGCANYSTFLTWKIMGFAIERITGSNPLSLLNSLQQNLGMTNSYTAHSTSDLPPVYVATASGRLEQQTNALAVNSPAMCSAGPASDYARFLNKMLNLLSESKSRHSLVAKKMLRPVRTGHVCSVFGKSDWGLGFQRGGNAFAKGLTENTFGHLGYMANISFVDVESGLAVVLLTNTQAKSRMSHVRNRSILTEISHAFT